MVQGLKNISLENLKNLYNNNMTKTRERNAAYLISLGRKAKGEATAKINKIITLYNQSKISQVQTAENIIRKLINTQTEKEQKSAFKQYEKIVEKYKANEPLNKRLTDKKEMRKKKQFYVSGKIHLVKTSTKTNKKGETKTYTWRNVITDARTITAKSKEEAENIFKNKEMEIIEGDDYELTTNVEFIDNIKITETSNIKPVSEADAIMKAAKFPKYHFIEENDKYFKNEGYCVRDFFVGKYSKKLKSLNDEMFDELCYESLGLAVPRLGKDPYHLDNGIDDDDDDDILNSPISNNETWKPSDGITPKMLNYICNKLKISCYAFDFTNKCFLKNISKTRNYDSLVYYCMNNHMYPITDKPIVDSLTKKARNIQTKIKTSIIEEENRQQNIYKDATIYDDIPVDKLMDYENCIIIYSKNHLNDEFIKIIELYNYIPKKKNQKFNTVEITFNHENKNIILTIDPNDLSKLNYKQVQELCIKNNIEFINQSYSKLIKQLKDNFYNANSIRHKFTTTERETIFNERNKICECCNKKLNEKHFHIDHITPLSCGGTNDKNNLQILCAGCHFEKSRQEQEEGYLKINPTESSFNNLTDNILNSPLCKTHAFIETLSKIIPDEYNNKIYYFDINKCRKNCLYYSQYEYPVFTVMDEPSLFNNDISKPGLYYLETDKYFPLRGNGWYSQAMVNYCISEKIIEL